MSRPAQNRTVLAALLAALAGLPAGLMAQESKPAAPATPAQPTAPAAPTKPITINPSDLKAMTPEEVAKMKAGMATPQPQPGVPGQALPNALSIQGATHDWGDISDAEPVSHTFNFTNASDKTVKITVSASCGCTVAGLEKDTYAPGEAGKVTATFNPQGRSDVQTKVLTMTVLDPQNTFAQQTMTVTANVKALVTTNPPKMYLSEVDHKAGQTSKLTITGRSPEFRITAVEPNSEFIKAKLGEPQIVEEKGEKFTRYEIELDVGKGAPIGNLNGQVSFTTNDEKMKVPAYFIGADVTGDVKATPPQAMLRVTNVSTNFTTQVRIDSRSGSEFHITSIDVEGRQDMKLAADAVKGEDGPYYMVTLSGMTPEQPGIVNGTLVVATDAQGGETLRVPFTAAVRKADANPASVKVINPGSANAAPPAATKQ